jgi:hypothetical protein
MGLGPEASLSLMTGQAVQSVISSLPDDITPDHRNKVAAAVASMVTFEVGLITFLLGLFRLGFLDAVLGRPMLRGFTTAIVCVSFLSRLPHIRDIDRSRTFLGNSHPRLPINPNARHRGLRTEIQVERNHDRKSHFSVPKPPQHSRSDRFRVCRRHRRSHRFRDNQAPSSQTLPLCHLYP